MSKFRYRYNPETCRYERVRPGVFDIVTYTFGILLTSALMLVGMFLLHDKLVQTERELSLRYENKTLKQHREIVRSELIQIEAQLDDLNERDAALWKTLFNTSPDRGQTEASVKREDILTRNVKDIKPIVNNLDAKASLVIHGARSKNNSFALPLLTQANLNKIPSICPLERVDFAKLISGFGSRINPFHKGMHHHPGIDFATARGTDVLATADGKVIEVKKSDLQAGYGNQIIIDHENGMTTRYAHLETIFVKAGQRVSKKMVIGKVGNSGGSVVPHVHYEVMKDGKRVNPVFYIFDGLTSGTHGQLLKLSELQNQSLD